MRIWVVVGFIFCLNESWANGVTDTLRLHDASSKALLREIDECKSWKLQEYEGWSQKTKALVLKSAQMLTREVKEKQLIRDDSLENYLLTVARRLDKHDKVRRVLIVKSADLNAFSTGLGVLAITSGLLAQIQYEEELAAILAHEVAHEVLRHHIVEGHNVSVLHNYGALVRQVNLIANGEMTPELIQEYQRHAYDEYLHKRRREIQADTLAFAYLKHGGVSCQAMSHALDLLNHGRYPDFESGARLFRGFHFQAFPFKPGWLEAEAKPTVTPKSFLYYSLDSLESHPDIPFRMGLCDSLCTDAIPPQTPVEHRQDFFRNYLWIVLAEGSLDLQLHALLQGRLEFPDLTDFNLNIAQILLKLAQVQDTDQFTKWVPLSVDHYSKELTMVNSFLYKTSREEKGEIVYHLLNHASVFKQEIQAYYQALIQACELTGRYDVKQRVQKLLDQRFPDR